MPTDFQFARPGFLILSLAAAAILVLYWNLGKARRSALKEFGSPHFLPHVVFSRSLTFQHIKTGFLCGSWLFATLALMGPMGNARYDSAFAMQRGGGEIIFALDVSDSMKASDTRAGLSRLEYAKGLINDAAAELRGQNVALFAFTSVLTPLVPETLDTLFLRMALSNTGINEGGVAGTDFSAALEGLRGYLEERPVEQAKTVILFSDGQDTLWELLEGSEKQQKEEEIGELARSLNADVITVGMGSKTPLSIPGVTYEGKPVTTRLYPELLKKMGRYFEAEEISAPDLAKQLASEAVADERMRRGAVQTIQYDLYFQFPLFFAILFLIAALAIPETRGAKALLVLACLLGNALHAETPEKLLLRANENLKAGFYSRAEADYRELLESPLELWQQDIVFYNLGTANLKQQRWRHAIEEFIRIDGRNLPPYLLAPFNRNFALALLGQAAALEERGYGSFAEQIYDFVRSRFDIEFSRTPPEESEEEPLDIEALRILKQAISKQEQALMTTIKGAVEKIRTESFSEEAGQAVDQQEDVIGAAAPFPAALLEWKREAYRENLCLEQPFGEVVPLFSRGLQAAEKAGGLLSDKQTFSQAVGFQWEAIDLWISALENWQEFDPAPDLEKAVEEEEELVREIVQMNQEDTQPEEVPAEVESVERPW